MRVERLKWVAIYAWFAVLVAMWLFSCFMKNWLAIVTTTVAIGVSADDLFARAMTENYRNRLRTMWAILRYVNKDTLMDRKVYPVN